MSLQPNFEVLWIEQVLKKPSKTNASKHSIHFPLFQGHKKSIRNSLFSNSLSKMLHFFSMKFATTLDFTGFPVISHLFTDGLTLECPFVRYSVKLQQKSSAKFSGFELIVGEPHSRFILFFCKISYLSRYVNKKYFTLQLYCDTVLQ